MPGFLGRVSAVLSRFSDAKIRQDIIHDGYKIVLATGSDEDRVLELMRRTFFKDEPAIVGCGIKLDNLSDSFQRYVVGDLSNGKSLLAVGGGDRLLGVCLANDLKPGASCDLQVMAGLTADAPTATLLRFWAHLTQVSRLPEAMGLSRIWEVEILATDPAARGLGIAKELTVQSRELARKAGFAALCVFCTSEYSGKLCRSLGMRHLLDVPYSEYLDDSGRQIITPPPPHVRVSIYVEELSVGRCPTPRTTEGLSSTTNK